MILETPISANLNRAEPVKIKRQLIKLLLIVLVGGLVALVLLGPAFQAKGSAIYSKLDQGDEMKYNKVGKIHAPDFEGGHGWFNVDHPIHISELRGKIVLLDFWTYCCINCMHIIPDLKKLENKYRDQLVVIGIHSAKFKNEKESDNIRQAILRYEIEHPVVNDSDFDIWQSYGARAWPTLVLIDPDGYLDNAYSGEGNYDDLAADITRLINQFRAAGKLKEQPFKLSLEKNFVPESALSFPGKVLADSTGNRLFISDSNHNRIVITNLTGETQAVIGNGQLGRQDGDYQTASFNHPQGLALSSDGNTLYVADTENHLLRRVDLKGGKVETLAGTGAQSRYFNESGPAHSVALSSPWDLRLINNLLFIAMAGPHQIWVMDLAKNQIGVYAGTGQEGRMDGPRHRAALAQPSGLTFDGQQQLFVADSEVSSIRSINLKEDGELATVVGSGELFGFGDLDGDGEKVRLQHPLGIDFADGLLYVADTYNHKIKIVDAKNNSCKTLLGTGKPGHQDGAAASFYEPGGLSVANGKIYIADTNNGLIRVADLQSKSVTTLKLSGLAAPKLAHSEVLPNREDITLPAQRLSAGKTGELIIDLKLPNGYHLNPEVNQSYKIKTADQGIKIADSDRAAALKNPHLPLKIPFQTVAGSTDSKIEVQLTFYYCPIDNSGVCKIKSLVWSIPIEISSNSKDHSIKLQYEVKN